MTLQELFSTPDKWTQHSNAKDRFGKHIPSLDNRVSCRCLYGGIIKCYPDSKLRVSIILKINSYINKHCLMSDRISYIGWNDAPERTFEDVQKLVKELDI